MHGKAKNANEAFNQLVLEKCPKMTFALEKIVKIVVSSAIIKLDSGMPELPDIFHNLEITPGQYLHKTAIKRYSLHTAKKINNQNTTSSSLQILQQRMKREEPMKVRNFNDVCAIYFHLRFFIVLIFTFFSEIQNTKNSKIFMLF